MNSKKYLLNEAERLFIYKYMTVDEIADRLNLNRNTVFAWKNKNDWEKKRKDFLKSKQAFHEELYVFARKLMENISTDIDNGEKIDPGRMYAFCRILPMFTKVKDYEEGIFKSNKKDTPKGLTPDVIAQIEEQVLGIKPPTDFLNENDIDEE